MAATAVGLARAAAVLALLMLSATRAAAVPLDELAPDETWVLGSLDIEGPTRLERRDVADAMTVQPRAWWAFWRDDPEFDPLTLRADVDRLGAFYRRRGYYEAIVHADAHVREDGRTVDVTISIVEGVPVRIREVSVDVDGPRVPAYEATVTALPLKIDEVFDERDYDQAARDLQRVYREAGHARVDVRKHARVDLDTHDVTVTYALVPGPVCVFGQAHVTVPEALDPDLVLAEVAFRPGDPFRETALERTRAQLQATHLFYTIRVEEEPGTSEVVDVRVHVREAPPRDIRLGVGYDTDQGPRGTAAWRHYNFLGGGRQLGVTARGSQIELGAAVDFVQPHWPIAATRSRLEAAYQEQDEESYHLGRASLTPRLEWQPRPEVATFLFTRGEYDQLTDVPTAVRAALPDAAPHQYVLSGLGFGVDAVFADDPLDPKRGFAGALTADGAGLGGDVHFLRAVVSGSVFHPLGFLGLLGAARARLGVVEPIAGDPEVPFPERLYAGGINSVRGYERRHVGPLVDDDPLGGRSLVEMSVELRRAIVGNFGAAVFVDAGHVGLHFGDFEWRHVKVGTGVGVRYHSPVGPIRVDLGFPLERPPGDPGWQIHVAIGRTF